jgi:Secretion system C-terminal sorting domain
LVFFTGNQHIYLKNGPIVIRGDSISSVGVLSWNTNNVVLKKEDISVAGGSFWSGAAYFPKAKITSGTQIKYKFFIENSSFGGWESGITDRMFNFAESDTTLFWHFFNDNISITGIKENINSKPYKFKLYQNYPNPFNPTTNFEFQITDFPKERSGFVTLKIYNILGKEVSTLVNKDLPSGDYKYQWNASGFSSGIYFYQLKVNEFIDTKKLILLK